MGLMQTDLSLDHVRSFTVSARREKYSQPRFLGNSNDLLTCMWIIVGQQGTLEPFF